MVNLAFSQSEEGAGPNLHLPVSEELQLNLQPIHLEVPGVLWIGVRTASHSWSVAMEAVRIQCMTYECGEIAPVLES